MKTKMINSRKQLNIEPQTETEIETEIIPRPSERVSIPAPNMAVREFKLIGVTPYVSNNFSEEARKQMEENQEQGSQSQKGKKRSPKDFAKLFRGSMHTSIEGWYGIPASTFRQAMVDACRTTGFKMTLARMGVFIVADGYDVADGRPLVRIEGEPREFRSYVRLANGSADIASRGRWEKWSLNLRVKFDLDMFSSEDIAHLLMRVGEQVGIGAGRPFSKTSCGQGWGTFRLADRE
jgi:hypothetical protein